MLRIDKVARRIAAIDEELLEECPQSDKIWANHIGYALSLTFVVIFGIVFYSLTYLDGAQIVLDRENNAVKFDTYPFSAMDYLKYGMIAMVIALVVFLFDRAFYQSDWFVQTPYGVESTIWEKSKNIISKFFRIAVRLTISAALAYALSIFLELKLYESELLDTMQKKHFNENKLHYELLKDYADTLNSEEIELKSEEARLLKQIQNISNGVISWSEDKVLNGMANEKKENEQKVKQNISELEKERDEKISALNQKKDPIEKKYSDLMSQYNEMDLYYKAEVEGIDEITMGGKTIKASGLRKEGKRAKMYKKRKEQLCKDMEPLKQKLSKIDTEISAANQNYDNQMKQIKHVLFLENRDLDEQEKSYKQKLEENFRKNAHTMQVRLQSELDRVQKRLNDLLHNKENYVKQHYQEVMQSPEFIQFRDGMMSRLIAFKELSGDPDYGKEITIFSWIVKGLLIFLEIIPVVSKMLFGPPTVYAAKLHMRAKNVTGNLFLSEGITLKEIEEQIEIENKKQELIDLKGKTRVKTSLYKTGESDLDQMVNQSVMAYASA